MSGSNVVDDLARRAALLQARRIERELHKRNVVVVPLPDGQHVIYRIPGWREAPWRRLRIAWYRGWRCWMLELPFRPPTQRKIP
jgi:hypothetical protein